MQTPVALVLVLVYAVPAAAGTLRCPPDAVKVGGVCVDKYEASVWQVSPANASLTKRLQQGKATLDDLIAGGATQLSPAPSCSPGFPANFAADGNWTPVTFDPPSPGVYAASIAGVPPSACITWFQANQACLLSGKRLLTNLEWQGAAAGTPDAGDGDDGLTTCATMSANPSATGARTSCRSSWGAYDMTGNLQEWVADWADNAIACTDWTSQTGLGGDDRSCFGGPGGAGLDGIPAALIRGGDWASGHSAGSLAVNANFFPSHTFQFIGFRCGR